MGCKRTTEDDKHPGSDLPQCQHRKVEKNYGVLHDKHLKLSHRYVCKMYVFIMPKLLIKYTTECLIAAHLLWPFFINLASMLLGHVIGLNNDVDSIINSCDANQLLSDVSDS